MLNRKVFINNNSILRAYNKANEYNARIKTIRLEKQSSGNLFQDNNKDNNNSTGNVSNVIIKYFIIKKNKFLLA
jgi:hypothetical protein